MCLAQISFSSSYLGVCWASWMFTFMSFIKFREFSAISSSNICSVPFSMFFLGLLQSISWSAWWCPTGPLSSVHVSSIFFFFLFLRPNNFHCPRFKFTLSPSHSNLFLNHSNDFSFQLLYFQLQNGFGFLNLYWYFQCVYTLFSWFSPFSTLVLWAAESCFKVFV